MNTQYRSSRDTRTCVARPRTDVTRLAISALSGSILLAFATASYAAGPVGGVVTNGGATITGNGSTTTITQTTANVVINWDSFSIGIGDTVRFVQPDSTSIDLG